MEVVTDDHELKKCQLKKSFAVDIEFQDLSYYVGTGGKKQILNSISGKFSSGELTGIIGSSGSGKTTLLNVLSGYTLENVTGNILVNENPRNMTWFRKISTYIEQDDILHEHLTVDEMMMIAARLRLSDHIDLHQKRNIMLEVLDLLGLSNCLKTRTECISGGERKRLVIALEMVSNPPVIFLDEPTSGLDVVAIRQCMEILKALSGQGRTVVCTIHQPSTNTLQYFNQVYFLHKGTCIYNGSTSNIVPFMSSIGYECPLTHNPSDYIIETSQTVSGLVPLLVENIQNGKVNHKENETDTKKTMPYKEVDHLEFDFPTSFWTQFTVVFFRMMLQTKRNKIVLGILFFHHVLSGIAVGLQFYRIGIDASDVIDNYKHCVFEILFFTHTYLMVPVLLFPFEVRLLKREYLNRWYGLKPYFLALSLKNLPQMILLATLFVTITYLLTGQPLEMHRFIQFTVVSILQCIATEALGLSIATVCNITVGSLVVSMATTPLFLLCVYGFGFGAIMHPIMRIVVYASYLRVSVSAIALSLYNHRSRLECADEIFCYYQDPKHLLMDVGISNTSYALHIAGIIVYIILFKVFSFLVLKFRLKSDYYNALVHYIVN